MLKVKLLINIKQAIYKNFKLKNITIFILLKVINIIYKVFYPIINIIIKNINKARGILKIIILLRTEALN